MVRANMRRVLVLVLLIISTLSQAADDVLTQAANLIKNHDYKTAYALLEPLEDERSGDAEFDFLLGVAGVESGQTSRGIFALERVLALQPNNLEARAIIGKAYYQAGETENAKAEFKNVQQQDTRKEYSKLIEGNLQAIDKATGERTVFGAYLDVGMGHDSNINSATSNSTVNVIFPGFGLIPFDLSKASREQSSNFMSAAGGISFRTPVLTKGLSMYGSVGGANRFNWSNDQFDTSFIDYNLGLSYKKFIDTFSVAYQGNSFDVNSDTFRRSNGLNAQWLRDVDDKNQVSIFANFAHLTYPDNPTRDANRAIIGGGWGHAFAGDKSPVIFLNAYTGKENADDSNLDNDIYGARLSGQLALNYKWVAYAGTGYEKRRYDGPIGGFSGDRRDNQYDVTIGFRYIPLIDWTIKPQLSYVTNDSNVSLLDFDRTILSVNVRKDFNW